MTSQVEILGFTFGPADFWMGVLIGVLTGALAGCVNGVIIARGRIPDFIATLGTLAAYRGIALLVTGGLPVSSYGEAREMRGYPPGRFTDLGGGDVFGVPTAAIVGLGLARYVGWLPFADGLVVSVQRVARRQTRLAGIRAGRSPVHETLRSRSLEECMPLAEGVVDGI